MKKKNFGLPASIAITYLLYLYMTRFSSPALALVQGFSLVVSTHLYSRQYDPVHHSVSVGALLGFNWLVYMIQ
jgi:hypothetical protein